MVDETGLDEFKVDEMAVDEIAVDEPGAHPVRLILTFLSDCILALLKDVCSPLKKILAVNINLLLGMRLQCTWSKLDCSIILGIPKIMLA